MWSGPRNISTAMMRAWESRSDTVVLDEPYYAYYLKTTGADHPSRDEIIATQESDPDRIARSLLAPLPGGATIVYQKHMTQHMVGDLDLSWMARVNNCFLIREPAEVLASYHKVMGRATAADVGLSRQVELFEWARECSGRAPPVLDARDVLIDPRRALTALCDALDLPFDDAMLTWRPGPRESDGVWAPYWYASVRKSTGFTPYEPREVTLPPDLEPVLDECRPLYQRLAAHRLLD